MSRIDGHIVGQRGQAFERCNHVGLVRARYVNPTVSVRKEHITAQDDLVRLADQNDVSWIVARQMPDHKIMLTQRDGIALVDQAVGSRWVDLDRKRARG